MEHAPCTLTQGTLLGETARRHPKGGRDASTNTTCEFGERILHMPLKDAKKHQEPNLMQGIKMARSWRSGRRGGEEGLSASGEFLAQERVSSRQ